MAAAVQHLQRTTDARRSRVSTGCCCCSKNGRCRARTRAIQPRGAGAWRRAGAEQQPAGHATWHKLQVLPGADCARSDSCPIQERWWDAGIRAGRGPPGAAAPGRSDSKAAGASSDRQCRGWGWGAVSHDHHVSCSWPWVSAVKLSSWLVAVTEVTPALISHEELFTSCMHSLRCACGN